VLGVSPIFLGLLAAVAVSGGVLWFGVLPQLAVPVLIVFVVAGWVASVCVHEFSHALVAYLGGDRSVAASGYLTFDPLRYTNVVLSIVMPVAFLLLGGIGLPGGAVYIDRGALRSRQWDSAVSLAGPIGTLVCGLVIALPFLIPGHDLWITNTNLGFFEALAFLAFIEVIALVLNLLPIPGLDGFGIIRPWLPYSVQAGANRFGMAGIFLVFILLWYFPPAQQAFFGSVTQITDRMGIDYALIAAGFQHMRFH
jgi:Zn-dependent protease